MTDMGLNGAILPYAIFVGILVVAWGVCLFANFLDEFITPLFLIIIFSVIFGGVFLTPFRTYSVSGTVTEVSDVLWDSMGKPFTEVKLDSIDHSVRMMGNVGVKELVGQEKTFTCFEGQITEHEPTYVCKVQ